MIIPQPKPLLSERKRHLLFMGTPSLWRYWPYLPLIRGSRGSEELGLMYDGFHLTGRTGYSAAVFVCNFFQRPSTEEALLALPREVFDRVEDLFDAGWRID